MAKVTATQAAAKWASRLQASTTEITQGVQAVTVAPGQLAAAQKQAWLQRTTAAADKWAARVGAVSLQDWKDKMINVGIPRISQGATANQPKVAAFMTDFLPFLDNGVQQVKAMPKVTLQDGIQRAVAMINYTATYKRK